MCADNRHLSNSTAPTALDPTKACIDHKPSEIRDPCRLTCFQSPLPTIEGLCATGGRGALDSPDAVHRLEGIASKPMPARLGFKVLEKQLDLSRAVLFGEPDKHVRGAQIAVVLENFVLQGWENNSRETIQF